MQHFLAQKAPHPDALKIRSLAPRLSFLRQYHVPVSAINPVGGFRKIPSFKQSQAELPGHQMARSAWDRIAMVGQDGSGDFAAQHSIDKKQMA
jgi:hypothetical protein